MTPYTLRVSRDGRLIFESPISRIHARSIGLLGWILPERIAEFPQDAPVLIGRLMLTVEDALQEHIDSHKAWQELCETPGGPISVEVTGLIGDGGAPAVHHGSGGGGGSGAWPGGGGGGGGGGLTEGGHGGSGADGAIVIFDYSHDRQLIDVEPLVTPGSFDWVKQKGVKLVDVIAIGGGGGGGSGKPSIPSGIAGIPHAHK